MDDTEFDQWENEVGEVNLSPLLNELSVPTQENVVTLLCAAIRETNKTIQAQQLVNVANMAMALADKILGSQETSVECVVLRRH